MDLPNPEEEHHRRTLDAMTSGRQLIVRFKAGGRIKEEHVYDSGVSVSDPESVDVFFGKLVVIGHRGDNRIALDTSIIGRGFKGTLPWEKHPLEVSGKIRPMTPAEEYERSCPIRVSDVIERPGTITIEFEASG